MRDRVLGSTIPIYFTTHQSTGVVVDPSSAFAAADFKIYKDGSATEKTTANGITVTSPFDSQTGAHLIEIDTSNSTGDSGFWASGSSYRVVISTAKTVDSKDPSGVCVGEFSLELQTADVRKFGGSAITSASGIPEVKVASVSASAVTEIQNGLSTTINIADSQAAIEAAIETLRATNHTVVSRSANDANPITFAWPVSGATITGTKSINNGSYSAVDGAISFLRTEDGKHYYTLAYDADDRITTEGQVRYKFVDGTYTRYVVLRVELSALSATTMNSVADSVLKRNVSNVEATADEHTLATAILSLLEWSISGGDLIIKRTDGTTTHYTKTLSSATGTGDVITGLN